MTRGEEVFTILQSKARSTASRTGGSAPTQEYLVRHLLESFLDRLVRRLRAQGWNPACSVGSGFPCGSVGSDYLPRHLHRLAAALPGGQCRDVGQIWFLGCFR